jgi:hypothetical protein
MNSRSIFIALVAAMATLVVAALWAEAPLFQSGLEYASAVGNIDSIDKYAWSEITGWFDLRPENGGVTVTGAGLYGYAWQENVGWMGFASGDAPPYANTDETNWGVNNDGYGNLSGYAWSENAGWINFNPADSRVTIDEWGNFSGYAWGDCVGWISFASSGNVYYGVKTEWLPPTPAIQFIPSAVTVDAGDLFEMYLAVGEAIEGGGKLAAYIIVQTPQGGYLSFIPDGAGGFELVKGIRPAIVSWRIPALDARIFSGTISSGLVRGDYWFGAAIFEAGSRITLDDWRSRAMYYAEAVIEVR